MYPYKNKTITSLTKFHICSDLKMNNYVKMDMGFFLEWEGDGGMAGTRFFRLFGTKNLRY